MDGDGGLTEADVTDDPVEMVRRWHAEAAAGDAVVLATASADGVPSARMVLLKGMDERGFEVHTNRRSRKARDLGENPRAALVFHWPPSRQVRVEGTVEELTDAECDAYWVTRPRGSQLGAWASEQSTVIASRAVLEDRLAEVVEHFAESDRVPRPPFWGGYRIVPSSIELWCHRDDRLHDRLRYRRSSSSPTGWVVERLSP